MCKIDANPINADTVKFTREGFDFESRTKVTTISGRNFYLTVYNVTEADAGKFTCEVNNGVGETVSNSSFLLVRRKYIYTMWKFEDFSFTQILCEINFGESRSSKTAVFVILRL